MTTTTFLYKQTFICDSVGDTDCDDAKPLEHFDLIVDMQDTVEAIPMYVEELLLLLTCYVEGTN